MRLCRQTLATAVGPMLTVAHDGGLSALEFDDGRRLGRLEARLRRHYPGCTIEEGTHDVIGQVERWLAAYFAGKSAETASLMLDARGQAFEMLVWSALRLIPPGTTTTYGAIAQQIGSPGAARAVGLANGANPIAIIVPCHRVIGANGTLTGYGGGLDRKAWLLNHERAHFFELQGQPR
jgi:O-6-methylguanine DNA methyltransferase